MALLITSASCTPLVRMRTSGGAPASARLSLLASGALSGRVAFVQAIVASPGGAPVPLSRRRCTTGNQSPQSDLEHFLEDMKNFKESRPTTAQAASPSDNASTIADIAKMCPVLLEELLRKYNPHPLPADTLQEVCSIGRSFLELVEQCNSGSLTYGVIKLAIYGLIKIAGIFPGEVHLNVEHLNAEDFNDLPLVARFCEIYLRVKSKYPHIEIE